MFGRKITVTALLASLVLLLIMTNLYSLIRSGWYSEQLRENVAWTQDAFENLFAEFDDILVAGALDEKSIMELESWVEKTSVQSAKVTFLDRNHFDLWDRTSDALELFEDFLEDVKSIVRARPEDEATIMMDQDSIDKLEKVYDDLKTFFEHVFSVDVLEEGTKWGTPRYGEMDKAIGMLSRFRKDVARAWLILPVLSGSPAPPPEVQAREILVEAVGEEYVTKYFELEGVHINDWEPDDWLSSVKFHYKISVGDYSVIRWVYFHFSKMNEFISSEGAPVRGNLMPFSVTRKQAVEIGSSCVEKEYVEMDAEISYVKKLLNDTKIDMYLWSINFYHTKKFTRRGSATRVIIDPISGKVIEADEYGWVAAS